MNHDTVDKIKKAIRERNGIYLEDLTPQDLWDAECMPIVAALPRDHEHRLRFLGDLLAQMSMGKRIEDDRLRLLLRTICTTLSYLLNSTSYKDKVLHDYDAVEITKRLRLWSEKEE